MVRFSARLVLSFAALCLASLPAFATPVAFSFSGTGIFNTSNTVTGFFVIDDSLFNLTSSQVIPNSNITQLSFTLTSPGVTTFGLADVVPADGTEYDSSGLPVLIVNGSGFLVSKGGLVLSINGADFLGLGDGVSEIPIEMYQGTWTEGAVPQVPLPAALPLFATGLGALGFVAYRRKRKQAA